MAFFTGLFIIFKKSVKKVYYKKFRKKKFIYIKTVSIKKIRIRVNIKTTDRREALTDMPPRSEDELDAVTLHNQASSLVHTVQY